jgi:transposase-like protein
MSDKRTRRSGTEIMAILREHFVEGKAVSEVCSKAGIHPTVFYRWQKTLFEGGAEVFDRKPQRRASQDVEAAQEKIAVLEQKLTKKHEVLSERMEEPVALKKKLGAP